LEELANHVDRFGIELPATVEGDRLRAVGVENIREDFTHVPKRGRPINGTKIVFPAQTNLRLGQAIRRVNGRTELGTLGADAAEVGRRGFDAAHTEHLAVFAFKSQPTADATIGTYVFTQRF